jgi:AcrR family transcriptional regulator
MRTEDQVEAILDAATPLFAEHGYDAVTTRQLAAAVGLNIATVHHHVGTKPELYARVVERLYRQEMAVVEEFLRATATAPIASAESFRDLTFSLLDRLLDLMLSDPARARLYVRRWLTPEDATHVLSDAHSRAFQQTLATVVERAAAAGVPVSEVDVPLLLRSFDWLVMGYFTTGVEEGGAWRGDPFEAKNVARFKAYLRRYLCRMLGLPE